MTRQPRNTWNRWLMMCFAVLAIGLSFAWVGDAYATTGTAPPTGGSGLVANCSDYPGIANRVVKCVRTTMENAAGKFFAGFYPMLMQSVTAFLTLGVVVYGVMMAAGMVEKIGRDSMVLLLKVAFVAYFVQNVDLLYIWIVQSVDSLAAVIFNFSNVNHPTAPYCMIGKNSVWERLDCLIDTLFGLKYTGDSAATSNVRLSGEGLARGMFAFFASAFLSSIPGAIIAIIGFMFMYTMLFFLTKVLFTFLVSYMAILFLMIIGPIFMPLVIFRTTKQYFDNWMKLVIACALQPIIIVAFASFSVAAIDVAVFSGEMSFVRAIAGDEAKASNFNLNRYIQERDGYKKSSAGPQTIAEDSVRDAGTGEVVRGIWGAATRNECGLDSSSVSAMAGSAHECAKGWVVGINFKEIDWAKLAEVRNPPVVVDTAADPDDNKEKALMRDLYASAILTAVTMFIMSALMQVVPQIANDLVGSYRQTPNLMGVGGGWKWQQQGSAASSNIASALVSQRTGGGG